MATAYLILGSNIGDRQACIESAKRLISADAGAILSFSDMYETEPWGFVHENLFLNQVIAVETNLNPFELLAALKKIEISLGRIRHKERYTARTIDIDILFYDDVVISTPELTIPHAEIANRRFVLEPLAELAPEFIHPLLKMAVKELLAGCDDECGVRKYQPC